MGGKKLWIGREDDLIIQILLRLPVVSLLRFKSVSKSWLTLIDSSFFINLHTFNSSSSSSSKFGSFIFHAAVDKDVVDQSKYSYSGYKIVRENTLIMLSSESESRSQSGSGSETGSGSGSESGSGSSGSSVCWWSSDPDIIVSDIQFPWLEMMEEEERDGEDDEEDDDQVFKVVDNNNPEQQLVFKLDNLGIPSCYQSFVMAKASLCPKVIGSCNGLICLYDGQHIFHQPQPLVNFSLWNPATRQFRILPKSTNIKDEDGNHSTRYLIAFGFDVETKDYNLVLVTLFKPRTSTDDCPCRVQVYSLSTDSWRLLEGITCLPGHHFYNPFEGQHLNGSYFFISEFPYAGRLTNNRFIISVDVTKEITTTIHMPDHDTNQELYLSSYLGDKLALFIVSSPYLFTSNYDDVGVYDRYDHFEIWVLNEHSSTSSSTKKESWTKLHSFQIKFRVPGQRNIPKGISSDGEFAFIETMRVGLKKKMKLYSLVTKEVKKNFLCCHGVMSKAAQVYKPSLVSIIGGNGSSSSSN